MIHREAAGEAGMKQHLRYYGEVRRRPDSAWLLLGLIMGSLLLPGCERPTADPIPAQKSNRDLLIAYGILSDTLADESKLGALLLLKRVTFNRPVPEIEDIMKRLSASAKERAEELEKLRGLDPDVSGEPVGVDAIGDAITGAAKEAGTDEMLGDESFGIRFVLLQAQATRMVAAISEAAAEMETLPERRKWLTSLAAEYEGFREELIDIVEKYVLQEGTAQQ